MTAQSHPGETYTASLRQTLLCNGLLPSKIITTAHLKRLSLPPSNDRKFLFLHANSLRGQLIVNYRSDRFREHFLRLIVTEQPYILGN